MSDAVLIGITASVLICVTLVLVALIASQAHQRTLSTLNSLHERDQAALDKTLDRLMAIKWEDFVAMRSYDDGDVGGFISPEEQKGEEAAVAVEVPGQWGALTALAARDEATENEQRLLKEDFPEERQAS